MTRTREAMTMADLVEEWLREMAANLDGAVADHNGKGEQEEAAWKSEIASTWRSLAAEIAQDREARR